jgi:hypothetical protein
MIVPRERWQKLCEQASIEKDSAKLLALVLEINAVLQAKENATSASRMSDRITCNKPKLQSEPVLLARSNPDFPAVVLPVQIP